MGFRLDHAVIAVHDLQQAMADYRELGFTVAYGGRHANAATHNALICFKDGAYLELLAPTGETPVPDLMDFSAILDQGEGLGGFALRSDDLDSDAAAMRARGLPVGPVAVGGRTRDDGQRVEWKLARIDDSFVPFFIQDVTPHDLRVPADDEHVTHANGAIGLRRIEIVTARIEEMIIFYEHIMGETLPHEALHPFLSELKFGSGQIVVKFPTIISLANARERYTDSKEKEYQDLLDKWRTPDGEIPAHVKARLSELSQLIEGMQDSVKWGQARSERWNNRTLYWLHLNVGVMPKNQFDPQQTHGVHFVMHFDLSDAHNI